MAAPLKSIPTWFGSHLPSWCVILLVMHSLHSAIAGVPTMEEWYFLPNFGKDIRGIERMESALGFPSRLSEVANALLAPDGGLTDQERKLVKWHPATFPHQDFVGMMPGRKVFGWYACVFDVPENKANQDLLVDLGLIDDADECYLNGQRIGGMGRVPGGSAWQSDRLYRVPAEKVRQTGNYLAVHVWSLWGLGGIVGPPILKLALASAESQWEIAMVKDTALPVNGLNGALTAEVACELCLPGQAPQWRKANLPWKNYSNWKDDEHLAMFWLGFPMFQNDGTPFCPTMPVALDLGPIFDVAAVFLNNQRIGLIGRFEKQEEPMFSEAACRACLQVPPEIWSRDGHNQLMIVVQRSRGIGGLPGVPGLCLSNPVENSSVARCREAFDSLVCSNRLEEAGDLLETHFGLAQADPVWFLSSRAYLSYLAWTDGGRADSSQPERLLADIAEILREHPSRSPRQSAMQAFCRVLRLAEDDDALLALVRRHFPHAMENSLALALDWESQGDWIPYRGYDMFILSSMGQVGDWYGGFLPFPYSRGIPGKRDTPRHWLDAAARRVHDASALLMPDKYRDAMFGEGEFSAKVPSGTGHFLPGQKVRRAAWWDDHGEMHPFDDDGPDLEAHIRETTEKKRILSVYMMDYDWRRTVHPRQQSVLLWRDGALANAFWLGKTDSGVYAPLALTGAPGQLTLRIMKHRGACVSVSGLFLDTLADSLPYLPLRFYPEGTCRIIPLQDVYQKDRLDGEVDKDTLHWYERMRTSQGIGRIALAREYAQRKNRLLSPSAGMVGRFIYAIAAENCGEATVALPDWTNALPTTLDGLHLLPVLLNCLSDGVGSVRHGCWYLFATKWALRHLPSADVLSVKEAGDFLCSLGMSCRGGPEAIPAMQACLEEARRRGAPDSQMWNLELYLQRSRGTTGISVVPATHVPPKPREQQK